MYKYGNLFQRLGGLFKTYFRTMFKCQKTFSVFPYSYRDTSGGLDEREIQVGPRARRSGASVMGTQFRVHECFYNVCEHGVGIFYSGYLWQPSIGFGGFPVFLFWSTNCNCCIILMCYSLRNCEFFDSKTVQVDLVVFALEQSSKCSLLGYT